MRKIIGVLLILCVLCACRTARQGVESSAIAPQEAPAWGVKVQPRVAAMPPVIVYKTRADYNDKVPVVLDPTRRRIISYPDPSDLCLGDGSFATPAQLNDGYLLDRRGVGQYTAFLDYSYADYSQLDSLPALDVLMTHIIDPNPIVEMWNCGSRAKYQDLIEDINGLIEMGFPGCTPVVSRRSSRQ